ncbi:putative protein transport protein USE1 [Cardiosporidium cionae]|uniref:Uncharacterized protein n=1 Tax=Cardiosporidium cionae TaxID=476202 RepID=A0ABQ7J8F1_9APIC|nr:putative protein transport protein USE1 [Cardiosporidium cionae]|eukprot:KAF8820261.1 putative protein transport protein USE1 [Cardiosporidium cionae]
MQLRMKWTLERYLRKIEHILETPLKDPSAVEVDIWKARINAFVEEFNVLLTNYVMTCGKGPSEFAVDNDVTEIEARLCCISSQIGNAIANTSQKLSPLLDGCEHNESVDFAVNQNVDVDRPPDLELTDEMIYTWAEEYDRELAKKKSSKIVSLHQTDSEKIQNLVHSDRAAKAFSKVEQPRKAAVYEDPKVMNKKADAVVPVKDIAKPTTANPKNLKEEMAHLTEVTGFIVLDFNTLINCGEHTLCAFGHAHIPASYLSHSIGLHPRCCNPIFIS